MSVQTSSPTTSFAILLFIGDRDQTFESHAPGERARSRFILSSLPIRIQPAPDYAPLDTDYAITLLPSRSLDPEALNHSDLNSAHSRVAGSGDDTVTLINGLHRLRVCQHAFALQLHREDALLREYERVFPSSTKTLCSYSSNGGSSLPVLGPLTAFTKSIERAGRMYAGLVTSLITLSSSSSPRGVDHAVHPASGALRSLVADRGPPTPRGFHRRPVLKADVRRLRPQRRASFPVVDGSSLSSLTDLTAFQNLRARLTVQINGLLYPDLFRFGPSAAERDVEAGMRARVLLLLLHHFQNLRARLTVQINGLLYPDLFRFGPSAAERDVEAGMRARVLLLLLDIPSSPAIDCLPSVGSVTLMMFVVALYRTAASTDLLVTLV
ncbi:hypothetical protein BD626DRAFT_577397 [Schizophyllum amplum]|uniref:Uncharacterized protein n=1 Tax=Schizophyllum amplum TaxID=97359 RepID=A0A550BSL9_9AGAR|nr:hypothetical protein BD626DRAFT_577397 [Auriculariopsis ampla]